MFCREKENKNRKGGNGEWFIVTECDKITRDKILEENVKYRR